MFNKLNKKIVYLTILAIVITYIGLKTDPSMGGFSFSDIFSTDFYLFFLSGFIFVIAVSHSINSIINKKYFKLFFWTTSGLIMGFIFQQYGHQFFIDGLFTHATIEGFMQGSLLGILLNPFNYILALILALAGLIIDIIIFYVKRHKKDL